MSALHDSSRLMMSFCRAIIFNNGVINERLFVIFASSVTNSDRAPLALPTKIKLFDP